MGFLLQVEEAEFLLPYSATEMYSSALLPCVDYSSDSIVREDSTIFFSSTVPLF